MNAELRPWRASVSKAVVEFQVADVGFFDRSGRGRGDVQGCSMRRFVKIDPLNVEVELQVLRRGELGRDDLDHRIVKMIGR